jgi:SAM-dependent methyltransferase
MAGQAAFFIRLFELVGHPLSGRVLDFGCGDGSLVRDFRAAGIDCYGCDFADRVGDDKRLAAIEEPYRLPYPAASFDAVVSTQVFEHVQDYDQALGEIRRVLVPGGSSAHTFPPVWTPIEPHVYVPFATVLRARWWLRLWAAAGIRNEFQADLPAAEVAELNRVYLRERTTYYRRATVLGHARRFFPGARLLSWEPLAASPSRRAQQLHALARRAPLVGIAYGELRSRTLLLR